MNTTTS